MLEIGIKSNRKQTKTFVALLTVLTLFITTVIATGCGKDEKK